MAEGENGVRLGVWKRKKGGVVADGGGHTSGGPDDEKQGRRRNRWQVGPPKMKTKIQKNSTRLNWIGTKMIFPSSNNFK
jgi:hypothetical protein